MRQERFELPTFGSVDRRSIQLSYWRRAIKSSGRASNGRVGGEPQPAPRRLEPSGDKSRGL
jgi:hypothetical protein